MHITEGCGLFKWGKELPDAEPVPAGLAIGFQRPPQDKALKIRLPVSILPFAPYAQLCSSTRSCHCLIIAGALYQ